MVEHPHGRKDVGSIPAVWAKIFFNFYNKFYEYFINGPVTQLVECSPV